MITRVLITLSLAILMTATDTSGRVVASSPNVVFSGIDFVRFHNTARTSFHALGRQWAFYSGSGLEISYATSIDGEAWQLYNTHKDATYLGSYIYDYLAADTNGTYVFVVAMKPDYSSNSRGNLVQFHYGKLAIDGTISWRGDFNVTSGINGICCYGTSYLRLDTSSHPFLSFSNSSATYAAWSIGGYSGWDVLELDKAPNDVTSLVQLSNGQMYVAYASTRSNTMFGRLWNGRTWEKEEVVTTSQFEKPGVSRVFLFQEKGNNIVAFYQGNCQEACAYSIERTTRRFSSSTWSVSQTVLNASSQNTQLFTITKDYRTDSYYLTTYGESKGFASVNTYLETHHLIRQVDQFTMNVSPCGCSGGFPSLTSDMLSSHASKNGADVFNVYYVMAIGNISEWLFLSQTFHVTPSHYG